MAISSFTNSYELSTQPYGSIVVTDWFYRSLALALSHDIDAINTTETELPSGIRYADASGTTIDPTVYTDHDVRFNYFHLGIVNDGNFGSSYMYTEQSTTGQTYYNYYDSVAGTNTYYGWYNKTSGGTIEILEAPIWHIPLYRLTAPNETNTLSEIMVKPVVPFEAVRINIVDTSHSAYVSGIHFGISSTNILDTVAAEPTTSTVASTQLTLSYTLTYTGSTSTNDRLDIVSGAISDSTMNPMVLFTIPVVSLTVGQALTIKFVLGFSSGTITTVIT